MKKLLILSLVIFNTAFSIAQTSPEENFKKLQWLAGEWNRTNTKPGKSGVEKWVLKAATELQGWGISMRGTDTAFVEKLKMIIKDNNIYYVADVPGNKEPTLFKLTKITDNEFVCENPEHNFPKQITYVRDGDKMKATISGNGKSFDYLFEKKL